jgi:hypothetical protein
MTRIRTEEHGLAVRTQSGRAIAPLAHLYRFHKYCVRTSGSEEQLFMREKLRPVFYGGYIFCENGFRVPSLRSLAPGAFLLYV